MGCDRCGSAERPLQALDRATCGEGGEAPEALLCMSCLVLETVREACGLAARTTRLVRRHRPPATASESRAAGANLSPQRSVSASAATAATGASTSRQRGAAAAEASGESRASATSVPPQRGAAASAATDAAGASTPLQRGAAAAEAASCSTCGAAYSRPLARARRTHAFLRCMPCLCFELGLGGHDGYGGVGLDRLCAEVGETTDPDSGPESGGSEEESDATAHSPSSDGEWTRAERRRLFRALAVRGRHDVAGIAALVGLEPHDVVLFLDTLQRASERNPPPLLPGSSFLTGEAEEVCTDKDEEEDDEGEADDGSAAAEAFSDTRFRYLRRFRALVAPISENGADEGSDSSSEQTSALLNASAMRRRLCGSVATMKMSKTAAMEEKSAALLCAETLEARLREFVRAAVAQCTALQAARHDYIITKEDVESLTLSI